MGEQLAGLVGPLQHGGDHLPVGRSVGGAGVEAGLDVSGGADDRGGAQVALAAQPAQQTGGPGRVGQGEFAHECDEPVVAGGAGLVEGPLGHEVGHRQQKELGTRVAFGAPAALAGAQHASRRRHARGGLRLGGLGVESRHGEFPRILLCVRRETRQRKGARGRNRRRNVRMLCRIELHRPEVGDGIRTRNRPVQEVSAACAPGTLRLLGLPRSHGRRHGILFGEEVAAARAPGGA